MELVTMIFSMKKKFDEKGYYWDRSNKGWMKTIVSLDKTKKNGYSLIGEFVNAGVRKNDYNAGLYLNCNKGEDGIVYQLIKVTDDEDIELLQTLENPGRGWAVELWEKIDEHLDYDALKPSYPDKFLNLMHLNSYLYHIGYVEMSVHMMDEGIEEGNIDDRDFTCHPRVSKYKQYLQFLSKVIFSSECKLSDAHFEEIQHVEDLLNLSYLESLRPDSGALGVCFHVRTSDKYFNRKKVILMTIKDGQYYIRWANYLL